MQLNKTHSESEGSSSHAVDVISVRERFLPATLSSSLGFRERGWPWGDLARLDREGGERVCIGGRELLPEDMLPSDGSLKACAKLGRECGAWVVMAEED
jgi:hypothetical protein